MSNPGNIHAARSPLCFCFKPSSQGRQARLARGFLNEPRVHRASIGISSGFCGSEELAMSKVQGFLIANALLLIGTKNKIQFILAVPRSQHVISDNVCIVFIIADAHIALFLLPLSSVRISRMPRSFQSSALSPNWAPKAAESELSNLKLFFARIWHHSRGREPKQSICGPAI